MLGLPKTASQTTNTMTQLYLSPFICLASCRRKFRPLPSHAAAKFGRGNVYSSANGLESFRSSPCALEIVLSVCRFAVFVHSPQSALSKR